MLFDLYVGSTDAHSAHADTDLILGYAARVGLPDPRVQQVWGVWEGVTEDVAQYTFDLPSDALAQRVATAIAALTGNDAVLVTRLSTDRDTPAGGFGNLSGYRVRTETRSHGTDLPGFAYVPDREGSHIAYLVTGAGTVSAVIADPTAALARTEGEEGSDVSAGTILRGLAAEYVRD